MMCSSCNVEMAKVTLEVHSSMLSNIGLRATVKHEWKDDKHSEVESCACPKCGKVELRVADTKILA